MRVAPALLAVASAGAIACGPARPTTPGADETGARIVAAERGRGGVALVFVDENGNRTADITTPPYGADRRAGFPVDTQPSWSADGEWIAFASNRGRERGTSIWLARARVDSESRQLVPAVDDAIDRDPCWSPSGDALVFSSNRGGSFDLWRVAIAVDEDGWPEARGEPERLTDAATDEVSPAWAPDGRDLAYAVFDAEARRSNIWISSASGRHPHQLTHGELEQSPAWSPSGRWIAFASPTTREHGEQDMDIYVVLRDGTRRRLAIDEPIAHETDPAWSADGRYLFATAVLRNRETGAPFFWSIVFVDGDAPQAGVRALHDPSAVPRVAFALGPENLRTAPLAERPAYDRDAVLSALREMCVEFDEENRPEACSKLMQ